MTYTFTREGAPQIDARNNVYYMAAGNSPSMMDKNIGQGSQYLWTYRDADRKFPRRSERTTNFISSPTFRQTISGRSSSTTRLAGRNCRTASRSLRSAVTRSPSPMLTAPLTSYSARPSQSRKAIGSRQCPARVGFQSSASMDRQRRFSTRLGNWKTSSLLNDGDVRFSNRPVEVKHFQTIHRCSVDVTHGLVLLFGIGTKALPSSGFEDEVEQSLGGLAVRRTAGPSGHTNSPHPSSREGHLSTARWSSSFLLSDLILHGSHAAAAAVPGSSGTRCRQPRCGA